MRDVAMCEHGYMYGPSRDAGTAQLLMYASKPGTAPESGACALALGQPATDSDKVCASQTDCSGSVPTRVARRPELRD